MGQTKYSLATLKYMRGIRDELDMMLHMGDISYANGLGLRWDTYGRMAEFFADGISVWEPGWIAVVYNEPGYFVYSANWFLALH